jgi:predicted nucleic acid-binding protein
MADRWAEVSARRQQIGQPILCGDCWIAAAALRHGVPLLTHNAHHFLEIPALRVISHTP